MDNYSKILKPFLLVISVLMTLNFSFSQVSITGTSNDSPLIGDTIWLYGENINSITSIDAFYLGEPHPQNIIDNSHSDSIQIKTTTDFNCGTALSYFDGVFYGFSSSLFVSNNLVTVAEGDASVTGTFENVMQNVCTGDTITFDAQIDTFYYDYTNVLVDQVTIIGNGQENTILWDINSNLLLNAVIISAGKKANVSELTFENSEVTFSGGVFGLSEGVELDLNNVTFKNNQAKNGGAIYCNTSNTLNLSGVLFSSNSASENGGAIYSTYDDSLYLGNCSFINNTSEGNGGAVYTTDSTSIEVQYSTFYNNKSVGDGGALYLNGTSTLQNVTIYKNESTSGYAGGVAYGGDLKIQNTAIGENLASAGNNNIATITGGLFTSLGYNYLLDITDLSVVDTDIINEGGSLYLDPNPYELGNQTYFKPYAFSPLVNNGAKIGLATDQLGNDIVDSVDIGAVEYVDGVDPAIITTTVDDAIEGSIRGALIHNNYHFYSNPFDFSAIAGDTISLVESLWFDLRLNLSDELISEDYRKSLLIDASGVSFQIDPTVTFNEDIFLFNHTINISNGRIDGEIDVTEDDIVWTKGDFKESCIELRGDDLNSTIRDMIIKNCNTGLSVEQKGVSIIDNTIYSNTDLGIYLDDINSPDYRDTIQGNVVGLDEYGNPGDPLNHREGGVIVVRDSVLIENNNISNNDFFGLGFIGKGIEVIGNKINSNAGSGLIFGGVDNKIQKNLIGIKDDLVTLAGNEVGLGIAQFDYSEPTSGNIIGGEGNGNIIAGSDVGIQIPSVFEESDAPEVYDNFISHNLLISNDTATHFLVGVQNDLAAPTVLHDLDSVLTGAAEPNAVVQVFLDSADNASYFVGVDTADANGDFSIDLKTLSGLPKMRYFTAMQTVGTNTSPLSSALALTIDCGSSWVIEQLSAYEIVYTGAGGTINHEVGQENMVFSCDTIEASFSSNDLTIYWDGVDLGTDYTIAGQDVVYFDVSDGFCSVTDSVQIVYNNNSSDSIDFRLNTFNASDQVYVRFDDFQQVVSAMINSDETTLLAGSTAEVLTENDDFIIEYSVEENVSGIQEIVVNLEDVCGVTKDVLYTFELAYEVPLVVVDTITLEVSQNYLLDKDSISVPLNIDATREITLLDQGLYASFLSVSVDILSGTHRGINIVALDMFPEFIGEDTTVYINYKICEVEDSVQIKCDVPGRIPVKLVRVALDLPIELSDGDLDAEGLGLTNRQIRNNIEIVVLNSAVTLEESLSLEFKWNGELLNPDDLQYELTVVSRWNDIVYQEKGSGKYPQWNGENRPVGDSQILTELVSEGNYFWTISVGFINEKGNTKKYFEQGFLYFKPSFRD